MNVIRLWILVPMLAVVCFSAPSSAQDFGEATNPELALLKSQFDEFMLDARKPITDFQARYEEELKKLKASAQQDGMLDLLFAVNDELENYKTGTKKAKNEQLARLQGIYANQMATLQKGYDAEMIKLYSGYHKSLTDLQTKLTQAGKLDEALVINAEIKSVTEKAKQLRENVVVATEPEKTSDPILVDLPNMEVEGTKKMTIEGMVLTSGRGYTKAETPGEYSPPIRITAEAKTDRYDLRLYYGNGYVGFNQKRDKNQLYLRDPGTGSYFRRDGVGEVSIQSFHTFVWEITEDQMILKVDGRERYRRNGSYKDISSQVGIGPYYGSTVTVKRLKVEKL